MSVNFDKVKIDTRWVKFDSFKIDTRPFKLSESKLTLYVVNLTESQLTQDVLNLTPSKSLGVMYKEVALAVLHCVIPNILCILRLGMIIYIF